MDFGKYWTSLSLSFVNSRLEIIIKILSSFDFYEDSMKEPILYVFFKDLFILYSFLKLHKKGRKVLFKMYKCIRAKINI